MKLEQFLLFSVKWQFQSSSWVCWLSGWSRSMISTALCGGLLCVIWSESCKLFTGGSLSWMWPWLLPAVNMDPFLNPCGLNRLISLLFRTSEERTLRLHASLPATRWPRHACTRRERVSAERVVQAFFVPYKNAGLQFQLSLLSCVRFSVCLGMILATWLKETFVYRAVKDVLAFEFLLGRNRECFVRTDIWHPPWASPRFACRAGLLCCLWKHGSTVPLVSWSCVRFEVCLGMIFATWLKETFVYHAVQDVLAFELFLGRNRECLVRTDIVVSESALRVSCRPYCL